MSIWRIIFAPFKRQDPTLGGRLVGRSPELHNAILRYYRGPCKANEYWKSLGA